MRNTIPASVLEAKTQHRKLYDLALCNQAAARAIACFVNGGIQGVSVGVNLNDVITLDIGSLGGRTFKFNPTHTPFTFDSPYYK